MKTVYAHPFLFSFALISSALQLSWANPAPHQQLTSIATDACKTFASTPATQLYSTISNSVKATLGEQVTTDKEEIEFRGRSLGLRVLVSGPNTQAMSIQFISPPMQPQRTVLTSFRTSAMEKPGLQLMLSAECVAQHAQQLVYGNNDNATHIQTLTPDTLTAVGPKEWLNPPTPPLAALSPHRLRVAMVDSGVNYLLPEIANALARDSQGKLIGYDFWEMDDQPFDAHPAQSPYMVQRHGTRTASIVIEEAPGVAIVPYRYPRPDMTRMADLIEHAAANQVRIVGMPLGGNRFSDWASFQQTAEAHPDMLFIASAGNNGRDIDQRGVYPASLEIDNMLVVTSADDFVTPAERTNYGRIAVDYMLPAERINALDYNGKTVQVSGSSYAVSRLVALAARLLNQTPDLSTNALKKAIQQYSVKANTSRYVSAGFIGDPLSAASQLPAKSLPLPDLPVVRGNDKLPLDLFVLNEKWQRIESALQQTSKIFSQCGLDIVVKRWWQVDTPEYLQNLSTGNAMTLRRKLPMDGISIVFANDTRMATPFDAEAFGEGNTGNRPWMRNSLWITSVTADTGIALAHELFHIVTNNGNHSNEAGNLMRERTDPSNTQLSPEQCQSASAYATDAQLLIRAGNK